MLVYEVNITVRNAIADEYRGWLGEHVRELLTLPGFVSAEVFVVEPEQEDSEHQRLVVAYRLDSHNSLTRYLREFAPAMRAKALEKFKGQFQIERRVLAPLVEMLRAE